MGSTFLSTDALLHHIWNHCLLDTSSYPTYESMIEKLKFTPRMWNSKFNLNRLLKHITWSLNIDITLNGIRRLRDNKEKFTCSHNNKGCSFFAIVLFHNPLIKLLFFSTATLSPVTLLKYKDTFYTLLKDELTPVLINVPLTTHIQHQNQLITLDHCIDIVRDTQVNSPPSFSIVIYTSYTFVHEQYTHKLQEGIIGYHKAPTDDPSMLHLFITGFRSTANMCILDNTHLNTSFNLKNIYSSARITEGHKIEPSSERINQTLLNQEHCICQHPDTQRYFVPGRQTFKNLGKLPIKKKSLFKKEIKKNHVV